ncbi:NAD(P)H-binding protein [Erysipelothrix sp. HDW6C]|uniref:NAD(P)-dependent oxidoreductase n=1 Tax=Erysipelothrix sp. HDW6C TaxID=2714930 RepID=UPI00140AAA5A|nr:NAD(P)H-binding protein [Erysipelothrix sp. HDW6C]QIK68784.1 NAD(P)H-binding protein [Erysipelothrix sp. HDW6C]
MKIGIIGATGMAGSALYHESVKRGHDTTAIVRDADKANKLLNNPEHMIVKDAFSLTVADLQGFDVIINAFSITPDKAYRHVDFAANLITMFRETETPRIAFILGAGSLLDQNDIPFVETLKKDPTAAAWIATPINQKYEYEYLKNVDNVNWVGVSPSAMFIPGDAHNYVRGTNHLLVNEEGNSEVTSGTFAVALLDEIETPTVHCDRFTINNA